jgi:hypothetical protein
LITANLVERALRDATPVGWSEERKARVVAGLGLRKR